MKELNEYRRFMKKEELHKSLNTLVGLLRGIAADGVVTQAESEEIRSWYALHAHLLETHPFNEIFPVIDLALSDGVADIEEIQDILWLCDKFLNGPDGRIYFDEITSDIQSLEGMLHGMISDGVLSNSEMIELGHWLNDHDYLSGTYPFDEVYSLLLAAKEDGKISDDERNMLKAFFANFVDTRESANIHEKDVKALQEKYSVKGICAIAPEIVFPDKTFCFTGASKRGTRKQIAKIICDKGGVFNDSITKATDFLVVGADGNPCWAFSCYGRKVEKAMDMRREGHRVIIVNEIDFWDEI